MPAHFPWERMCRRPPGLWRYREALPLPEEATPVSLGETRTPLLARHGPAGQLYLKLDFLFPSGSFKDRGAAVLMSQARHIGVTHVVEDSSGNAGAAIAAYAAAAGISATIVVPASAPPDKTSLIALYGARLVRVEGARAATTEVAQQEAQRSYYASHIWNPFFLEGTKTVAFEIWEQLQEQAPQWVITPVGHGSLLLGLHSGFNYLRRAGAIGALPRIVGVQAAAVAPLVTALGQAGHQLPDVAVGNTLADGIAVARPLRWRQILAAVRATGGNLVAVGEGETWQAMMAWARQGILMEPTSATALAAYATLAAQGVFAPSDTVVVLVTGSGIKTAQRIDQNLTKQMASGILGSDAGSRCR